MNRAGLALLFLSLTSCAVRRQTVMVTPLPPIRLYYPLRATEKNVSWEQAIELLKTGKIHSIGQAHSLTVWLNTSVVEIPRMTYVTREPGIDDVFGAAKKYAPNFKDMSFGTE
jgi:hypothetical protein